MTQLPYPQHWPKPNKLRPNTVASKVTDEVKTLLFQRKLTTRQLAKELNVSEKYLSGLFPGKDQSNTKKATLKEKAELIAARKDFRLALAKEILEGKYTITEASQVAFVSYNTMLRTLAKAKTLYPELVPKYELNIHIQRQETVEKARNVRRLYNAK